VTSTQDPAHDTEQPNFSRTAVPLGGGGVHVQDSHRTPAKGRGKEKIGGAGGVALYGIRSPPVALTAPDPVAIAPSVFHGDPEMPHDFERHAYIRFGGEMAFDIDLHVSFGQGRAHQEGRDVLAALHISQRHPAPPDPAAVNRDGQVSLFLLAR